jgi:(p)ppGpp synthase/HD superfamily hydrolase
VNLAEVDALAARAHAGQVDKIGVDYIEHPRAVAAGLMPFGEHLVMAGLLHDVLEDTAVTAADLLAAGVPARVVEIVQAVTNVPGLSYEEKVRRIAADRDACLVKIADNASNSDPDRAAKLPAEKRERLAGKYRQARDLLWPAAAPADIAAILQRVNPALMAELHLAVVCGDCESGRCHWGGERSRQSEAAVSAGGAGEDCGCQRHATSVQARSWNVPW